MHHRKNQVAGCTRVRPQDWPGYKDAVQADRAKRLDEQGLVEIEAIGRDGIVFLVVVRRERARALGAVT